MCVYLKVVTENVMTGRGTVPIHKDTRGYVPSEKRPESISECEKMHGLSHSGNTPVSFL